MNRPNLFSLAAAAVLFCVTSSEVMAQYPPQYPPQYCPPQQQGHPSLIQMPRNQYQAPVVDHYVEAAPALWDENRPIEHFLHDVTSRSWLRLEFMQWSYGRPGDGTIGSPVSGLQTVVPLPSVQGIDVPVAVNDNLNGGTTVGQTLFPQSDSLNLNDVPGMRGTLGVAMNGGDMELSFFGFQQASDTFGFGDIDGARQLQALQAAAGSTPIDPTLGTVSNPNYAIPLLTNGSVTDVSALNSLIFDKTFQARFSSQMWGSELTFLTDRYVPGEGFGFQWLGGIRYTNLDENFDIHGTYDGGAAGTDRTTDINSSVINNLYGPEAGARFSLNSRWFTLSATPRVMLGLNDYTAKVSSDPLGTGRTSFSNHKVDFGTITQLNLAAEVHFSTKFSMYAGYDFMWIPQIVRPNNNIYYNSIPGGAAGFTPDIRQDVNDSNFYANGFSLGAVFRY